MARILVVEEDASVREALVEWLGRDGHDTLEAVGVSDAMRLARKGRPAAVVLDAGMRNDEALRLCESLKAHRKTTGLPILALIASHRLDAAELLFRHGADEVLSKPFRREKLLAKLAGLLRAGEAAESDDPLVQAFLRIQDTAVLLGDVAEIFPGVTARDRKFRRYSAPGAGWMPIIPDEALAPFQVAPDRVFLRFDRASLLRVPAGMEYDQPEKVVVRRIAPPLAAAIDRTRCAVAGQLYSIVPARGLSCGYLACLLNSRLVDYFYHRVRRLSQSFLTRRDLEELPVMPPAVATQKKLVRLAQLLETLGPRPGTAAGRARHATALAEMNRLVFAEYGLHEEDVRRLAALHF